MTWQFQLANKLNAACVLEAAARKPGNVHPEASFENLRFQDFVQSAAAAAPCLSRAGQIGVGAAILEAVTATRRQVSSNTNLGMILLLAPLAAVPQNMRLRDGIQAVLRSLTVRDAELAYLAIQQAQPGGMGAVERQDVNQAPGDTLLNVMKLASDRDLIARQYAEDFSLVLDFGMKYLAECDDFETSWENAVIRLQLELLSRHPDSLIHRKCGRDLAGEASRLAKDVLANGWPVSEAGWKLLKNFDAWLRADGNHRNPGTTADLVAACLFAAFREDAVKMPDDEAIRVVHSGKASAV